MGVSHQSPNDYATIMFSHPGDKNLALRLMKKEFDKIVRTRRSSRFELGASIRSFFKFELLENVDVTNRISLYSDYLNNPSNIDLDYTINTVMKVNKYLTTNLIIQFIYDDNSVKRLQVREVMGIGISLDI